LITKIQFNNYETGEFTEEKERTLDETIALINAFPWEQQRKDLRVSPTNPSITTQNTEGSYLKIALYYNGKFVLYFLDPTQKLYAKSFFSYADTYPYIRKFVEQETFDSAGFLYQRTWPSHNLIHFADKDFHYELTDKSALQYLLVTSWFSFAFTLALTGVMIAHPFNLLLFLLVIFPTMFVLGGGLNLLLFANYYPYCKGKLLFMSKGHDIFYYGLPDNPESFDKKNITSVTYHQPRGTRNPLVYFSWVNIEFKDARKLVIPNLLIDSSDLINKLAGFQDRLIKKGSPFIPRDASAPS
jgi:hypothetical protein